MPDAIDLKDMSSLVQHFPDMLTWLSPDDQLLEKCNDYRDEGIGGICFIGMGGSSIVGQYISALVSPLTSMPIAIGRDYQIPNFVSNDWIVIAVSYSGNTAETLLSLSQAEERGSKIVLVTSGGKMQDLFKQHPHLLIQKGLQPRAALPLLLSGILPITETLAGTQLSSMKEVSDKLQSVSGKWGNWVPRPTSLAESLLNKVPIFIGAEYMRPVAYRAKCQINENAKTLAFNSEIPESAHNEIEGFHIEMGKTFVPVFLRSDDESIQNKQKTDVMTDLYKETGMNPVTLKTSDSSQIVNMLSMTHYLDTVTVELAGLRGADPLSVERITELKKRLAQMG